MNLSSLTKDSSGLVTRARARPDPARLGRLDAQATTSAKVVDVNHAPRCQVAGSDSSTPRRDAARRATVSGVRRTQVEARPIACRNWVRRLTTAIATSASRGPRGLGTLVERLERTGLLMAGVRP